MDASLIAKLSKGGVLADDDPIVPGVFEDAANLHPSRLPEGHLVTIAVSCMHPMTESNPAFKHDGVGM